MGCVTTAVPFATIWFRSQIVAKGTAVVMHPILRVITVDIIVALYICEEIDRCALMNVGNTSCALSSLDLM